ncbi:hypothetical protein [Nonomuraea sp. bgisy101]|uniref:hypothetical protein n=1 Tax=Nonomuraea sp. bgisy101 TaxID=3413784 RepID=UPI003D7458F1
MTRVDWQAALDLLASILRQHGQAPDAITDTMAAWAAFAEFAQTKVAGIDTQPDSDSDGFILQWGRWSVLSSHSDHTGFYFPNGDEEWQAALAEAQDFPPFQAVAKATPVSSALTLEHAD